MSANSFAYRYGLNRNPYVADENVSIIYPYERWGTNAASGNFYVYGRELPSRSYFGDDANLSARPITRVIQPSVLEYLPPFECALHKTFHYCEEGRRHHHHHGPYRGVHGEGHEYGGVPVTVAPIVASRVLNNRFAALGAQAEDAAGSSTSQKYLVVLAILLAIAGIYLLFRPPRPSA